MKFSILILNLFSLYCSVIGQYCKFFWISTWKWTTNLNYHKSTIFVVYWQWRWVMISLDYILLYFFSINIILIIYQVHILYSPQAEICLLLIDSRVTWPGTPTRTRDGSCSKNWTWIRTHTASTRIFRLEKFYANIRE